MTKASVYENTLIQQAVNPTFANRPVHPGMPPLDLSGKAVSFFEFWPTQLVYLPVVVQWLMLTLKYRSINLPLIANPKIPLGGMVGEAKSDVFKLANGKAKQFIAPAISLTVEKKVVASQQVAEIVTRLAKQGIQLPVVAKPDIGCRGVGVRIVRDQQQLVDYIEYFPNQASLILQELVPYEAEAGIFYIRYPGKEKGEIFSITLKYAPYVFGNGKDNLQALIEADPRASKVAHLYLSRHQQHLDIVLPEGQPFRLAFAGSHSRGSIFRDGKQLITPALTAKLDEITKDIDEFYYGRLDVRFKDAELLKQGRDFKIVEINGASSEATHIWDRNASLKDVYKALFYQYKTLFEIGEINRRRGFKIPGLKALWQAYKKEKNLVASYPATE
ncbi:ATP-grasp domain-containing protein [Spartinivicinus ruber]|uniref:ATP-grasp domain-containing protein n=1 Tax=Spartinivicinus ruber TaxID=2683272 RepID=UPI001E2FB9BD|nr:ATP-grasp domain-containing protein [Spartinivicinus ruber]